MKTFDDLTSDQVIKLADSHIRWFNNILNGAFEHANEAECLRYLEIWQEVKAAAEAGQLDRISEDGRGEIEDAILSGEYDDILTPEDKLPKVRR